MKTPRNLVFHQCQKGEEKFEKVDLFTPYLLEYIKLKPEYRVFSIQQFNFPLTLLICLFFQ
jgi:hypothetical protein